VSRTPRGIDARNRYNEKMKSAAARVSICWRAAVFHHQRQYKEKACSRKPPTPVTTPSSTKSTKKALVFGANTLLTEFRLEQGAILPRHSHPHEQTGYLVAGRLELTIGDVTCLAEPGDSWCIPGGTPHHAHALADCVAIEVFSPVREDYLPQG